jgi:hypothetical protein
MSLYSASWFSALLLESHRRFVGAPLAPLVPLDELPGDAAARWLYDEAPFGLLAHDGAKDPRFIYANRTAQRRFEYGWDDFVGLPSRLSALPDAQEDRDALLRAVSENHAATGYRGARVSRTGRRFWIENVTMWDLIDGDGATHGQAAVSARRPMPDIRSAARRPRRPAGPRTPLERRWTRSGDLSGIHRPPPP